MYFMGQWKRYSGYLADNTTFSTLLILTGSWDWLALQKKGQEILQKICSYYLKESVLHKSSVTEGSHLNITGRDTVELKTSTYMKITCEPKSCGIPVSVQMDMMTPTYQQLCPQHCPALIKSVLPVLSTQRISQDTDNGIMIFFCTLQIFYYKGRHWKLFSSALPKPLD